MKGVYIFLILTLTAVGTYLSMRESLSGLGQPIHRFNPEISRQSVYFSIVTNCPIETIGNWSCGQNCQANPGMVDVKAQYNKSHSAFGYVGYYPSQDLIVIAVRGSKDWKNWLTDFEFWKKNYSLCEGCQVEAGFYNNYLDLEDLILNHTAFLKNKYPTAQVLLTGHSLGGATVTVAAPFVNKIAPVKMIQTFGCPMTGNQKFVEYFNTLFKDIQSWRVVNYHDPVPHLPPGFIDFHQYNTEVWFNTPNYSNIEAYDVCYLEEEPYCSSSVAPTKLNPDNHNHYLGVDMGACNQ